MTDSPCMIPTAPGRLPVLGHAIQLLWRPLEFVDRQRAHGDVVAFRLGRKTAYLVNSPEIVWELLVERSREFTTGVLQHKLRPFLGNGLVTSEGAFYHRQRRLMQPAFHPHRIAHYADVMRECATTVAGTWRHGHAVSVTEEMHRLATITVVKTMFSSDLDAGEADSVVRHLPVMVKGAARRAYASTDLLDALPTPGNRRFAESRQALAGLVDRIISGRAAGDATRDDLLSMLLAARDEDTGEPMTAQQIHDEVITILTAGTETVAVTLAWVFHVLGHHPEIENRLLRELDTVLADRPVRYADIARLNYLRSVLQETLRVYPPAWLIPRCPLVAAELGGHRIPAGANVFFSPYVLHHDPNLFPQPACFDPDRWSPARARDIPRGAYIPFGAGVRKCIGDSFAWTETAIAVATIARRWRLRPVPGATVRTVATSALHPSTLPMTVEERSN